MLMPPSTVMVPLGSVPEQSMLVGLAPHPADQTGREKKMRPAPSQVFSLVPVESLTAMSLTSIVDVTPGASIQPERTRAACVSEIVRLDPLTDSSTAVGSSS